jgi:hypothetical protein
MVAPGGQPIPKADPDLLHALYTSYGGGQAWAEQNAIGGLVSEALHGSEAEIRLQPGARCRDSRCMRYRRTTVLLNESRGFEQYQSMNSRIRLPVSTRAGYSIQLFNPRRLLAAVLLQRPLVGGSSGRICLRTRPVPPERRAVPGTDGVSSRGSRTSSKSTFNGLRDGPALKCRKVQNALRLYRESWYQFSLGAASNQ